MLRPYDCQTRSLRAELSGRPTTKARADDPVRQMVRVVFTHHPLSFDGAQDERA